MLPVLLDFGFIKIYTFGICAVLGFFWGLFLLWKLIGLTSYKEEDIFDGVFIGLIGGLIGARLVYVWLNFSRFGFNILKIILINGYPGLFLYAGLACGFLCFYLFIRSKKIPFIKVIDYAMPGLFLALVFMKCGAFLSGGESGSPTHFFLKAFSVGQKEPRHITGVYEAIFFIVGAYIAHRILLLIRREKLPHGFGWYFFMSYFSLVYLLLDKIKADHIYLVGFSVNFGISLLLFIFFILYFLVFFHTILFKNIQLLFISLKKYVARIVKKITRRAEKKAHAR